MKGRSGILPLLFKCSKAAGWKPLLLLAGTDGSQGAAGGSCDFFV
jgi:hypothetical protein